MQDLIQYSGQVGYLLPDNEQERLGALDRYDLDGIDVGEWADRIATLVSNHFDVPVAFVGLVEEDEENFLGCHGADRDSLNREGNIAAGLEKAFAGRVELRREGGQTEIRADGLEAGADEWQRVTL